ncbi:MAG: FAD-dependent oxidoreductase [Halanaerobiales bacterium]
MKVEEINVKTNFIIVGAGIPGICAAIQASRLGAEVTLISDRIFIGGNPGAEMRINMSGSIKGNDYNFYSREGGIIEELCLENLYKNPSNNPYRWDALLKEFIYNEENLNLYLNIYIDEVDLDDKNNIKYVSGTQRGSEKRFKFYGDLFLDNTGDGTVSYLAGADYHMGRESENEYNEKLAPEQEDKYVNPNTLTWYAIDTGKEVEYIPPNFATNLEDTNMFENRNVPKDSFTSYKWFYDLDGQYNQIDDYQKIVKDQFSFVYGLWDYIKNSGEFEAETYDIQYIAPEIGKRESRRVIGDYILTENDVTKQNEFMDVIAHGGYPIDPHAVRGVFSNEPPAICYFLKGIYQIPYRTIYSHNVNNLFTTGRCVSTSHIALQTIRVTKTLAALGQAAGAAAYVCLKNNETPPELYENRLEELKQLLLKENQYLVNQKNKDSLDKARFAHFKSSSVKETRLLNQDDEIHLKTKTALILPVKERINTVSLLVKNSENTKLNYKVYIQDKKYSFYPERILFKNTLNIEATKEFRWIELPVEVNINENYIYLEIEANNNVYLGTSEKKLVGINTIVMEKNNSETHFYYDSLERPERMPKRIEKNLCFKTSPEQNLYSSEEIVNGHSRPYGLPNAWMSKDITKNNKNEWLKIDFQEEKKINEIRIFFDSNNNQSINYYQNKGFRVIPTLVKDYIIYYKKDDSYIELKKIKNNYLRLNRIELKDSIKTKKLKIEFLETNGSSTFNVFEIRVY